MKTVSAAEANRQFSRILREVAAGETIEVTSHGRAIARIFPIVNEDDEARKAEAKEQLLARLSAQPALNAGPWTREDAYEDDGS